MLRNYKGEPKGEQFRDSVVIQESTFDEFNRSTPLKNLIKLKTHSSIKDKYSETLKGININDAMYMMKSKRNTQCDVKWISTLRSSKEKRQLIYVAKNEYTFKA